MSGGFGDGRGAESGGYARLYTEARLFERAHHAVSETMEGANAPLDDPAMDELVPQKRRSGPQYAFIDGGGDLYSVTLFLGTEGSGISTRVLDIRNEYQYRSFFFNGI